MIFSFLLGAFFMNRSRIVCVHLWLCACVCAFHQKRLPNPIPCIAVACLMWYVSIWSNHPWCVSLIRRSDRSDLYRASTGWEREQEKEKSTLWKRPQDEPPQPLPNILLIRTCFYRSHTHIRTHSTSAWASEALWGENGPLKEEGVDWHVWSGQCCPNEKSEKSERILILQERWIPELSECRKYAEEWGFEKPVQPCFFHIRQKCSITGCKASSTDTYVKSLLLKEESSQKAHAGN